MIKSKLIKGIAITLVFAIMAGVTLNNFETRKAKASAKEIVTGETAEEQKSNNYGLSYNDYKRILNGIERKEISSSENEVKVKNNDNSTTIIKTKSKNRKNFEILLTNSNNNKYQKLVRAENVLTYSSGKIIEGNYQQEYVCSNNINDNYDIATCGTGKKFSTKKFDTGLPYIPCMDKVYWYQEEEVGNTEYLRIGCKAKYKIKVTGQSKGHKTNIKQYKKYVDGQRNCIKKAETAFGVTSIDVVVSYIVGAGVASLFAGVAGPEAAVAAFATIIAAGLGISLNDAYDGVNYIVDAFDYYDKLENEYLLIRDYGKKYK